MQIEEARARAAEFFADEMTDNITYGTLARSERPGRLRDMLAEVATIEERHSGFWRRYIKARGGEDPKVPSAKGRLRLLAFLRRFVSPVVLVSTLELGEGRAAKKYFDFLQRAPLDEEEKAALRGIILDELEHEVTFKKESQSLGFGSVRDFVLGMNDGLVEILGTVTGLTAVYAASPLLVGVSGLVVGVAGALSMGIGAFMSVRSQRQVNEGARERLSVLFAVAPERATDEYREQLRDSGVSQEIADAVAKKVGESEEAVTKLLLGTSEESELRSGILTGLAYLVGVAFPVVPYFIASTSVWALGFAVLFAGLALAATGSMVSILSGIPLGKKVTEMVTAGLGAAALSYAFGSVLEHFVGVHL